MKRVLAVIGMILSILLLLGFLGGVIGVWVVRGQVLQTATVVATTGTEALGRAVDTATKLTGQLDQTQARITDGVSRIEAAGAKAEQSLVIMEALLGDLQPAVDQITQLATNLQSTVAVVDQVVTLLQQLPFMPKDAKLLGTVDSLVEGVKQLGQRVQEAKAALASARAQLIGNTVQTLTTPLNNANGELKGLQDMLKQVTAMLAQFQARIPALLDQFQSTVTWIAVGATVILLWMVLSQAIVFLYCYRLFTGHDLLAGGTSSKSEVSLAPM